MARNQQPPETQHGFARSGRQRRRAGDHDRRSCGFGDFRCRSMGRTEAKRPYGQRDPRLPAGVDGLLRTTQKKTQPWADLISTYGLGILDFPGAPRRTYELLLGIYSCLERVEIRRSYRVTRGISSATAPVLDLSVFRALFDTEQEATARHAIHAASARSQSDSDHSGNGEAP